MQVLKPQMNPIALGGTAVLGIAAFLLFAWTKRRMPEGPLSMGKGGSAPPEVMAQGTGADFRIVQEMVNEVESRLRAIRRMPEGNARRQATAALLAHYAPEAHAGTGMEGNYRVISQHIRHRLHELHLLPA
eukprot:jgi/Tetstr1/423430/TSEL_014111.t1